MCFSFKASNPGLIAAALLTTLALGTGTWALIDGDRNALWSIVEQRCLVGSNLPSMPPCVEVAPQDSYVIIKDRKGSRHFLLMPSFPLEGIEASELLKPDTPNFFKLAVNSLDGLERRFGLPGSKESIGLAVNSKGGRSQDHLHVHIACLKQEVEHALAASRFDAVKWVPIEVEGNQYHGRAVTQLELDTKGPFLLMAEELPGARYRMGEYGIALVQLSDSYVLLATRRDVPKLNFASAGEILDHDCDR